MPSLHNNLWILSKYFCHMCMEILNICILPVSLQSIALFMQFLLHICCSLASLLSGNRLRHFSDRWRRQTAWKALKSVHMYVEISVECVGRGRILLARCLLKTMRILGRTFAILWLECLFMEGRSFALINKNYSYTKAKNKPIFAWIVACPDLCCLLV